MGAAREPGAGLGSGVRDADAARPIRRRRRRGGGGGGGGIACRPSVDVFEVASSFEDAACGGDGGAGAGGRRAALLEHASLRLPFALAGGYALAMIAQYLSAFLINVEMHTSVYLVVANVSLVGLCAAGFALLWRGRSYGAGGSLMWYLVRVFVSEEGGGGGDMTRRRMNDAGWGGPRGRSDPRAVPGSKDVPFSLKGGKGWTATNDDAGG